MITAARQALVMREVNTSGRRNFVVYENLS
jgi:hypothetical protein